MPEQNPISPLLLAGRWSGGSEGRVIEVENPSDESVAGRVSVASEADVTTAVREAERAQRAWGRTPAVERAGILLRLAELIDRDAERLARIVTSELGKPIRESRGEAAGAANFCRYFAALATTQGGEIMPSAHRDGEVWIRREPVGVVGAIIPWNFPLALTARKLAPALAAGDAIVLKPAELTPLSALALAELAVEAGVPEGVLSVLPGPGSVVGAALVRTPGVEFVTMTGSVRAGRSILRDAAERIIPVSLELGGKAPFIVFADSDLDAAVASALATRMMNNGQACVCNERTYVEASVYREFVERYRAGLEALVVGDPASESTDVGPKVSAPELANVHRIVRAAVGAGATLVTGGDRLAGSAYERGHWYAPTLLTDVAADSPALREEVFGPVTPIVSFEDEAEAIGMANDTSFGLSSYLYTNDYGRVMRMTEALRSGEVFINRGGPEEVVGFHAGWGESGLGGDDSTHGFELYSRRKTVYASWGGAR